MWAVFWGVQQGRKVRCDRRHDDLGRRNHPSTDDEDVGVRRVRQADEPNRHVSGEAVDDRQRVRFPAARTIDDILAPFTTCESRQRGPGRVTLPTSSKTTRTQLTVDFDDDVPDLAGESVRTSLHHATGDETTADSRTERDHPHVGCSARSPHLPLAIRRRGRVVVDGHRNRQHGSELIAERQLDGAAQIRRRANHSLWCDESRHSDSDGVEVAEGREKIAQRVSELGCVRCRHALSCNDIVVVIEKNCETLRPADVDAGAARHDSMRALSSFNVLKIRTSARRLTKPGNGMINSIDKS